jgi:5-oxoprolinase (ATP-hydrolysing)
MTNTRMTDPEVLETRFPVVVEEFSIRSGSGGTGKWHGGEGITRALRFNEAMTVTTLTSHRVVQPHGAAGGKSGGVGRNEIRRSNGETQPLKGNDQAELHPGDVFVMHTPGGGGYGAP